MTIPEAKDWATIVGVAVGAFALIVSALTTWLTWRTNRARLWLDLRSAFASHDEVHQKLRSGAWSNSGGPNNVNDYAKVEAYMGLFEHCESLLRQNLIDKRTFREIYLYRLRNLLANQWVRNAKLNEYSKDWRRFIALIMRMRLGAQLPERAIAYYQRYGTREPPEDQNPR